jgi:hypothetical protein
MRISQSQIAQVTTTGVFYVNFSQGEPDNAGASKNLPVKTLAQALALIADADLTKATVVVAPGQSYATPSTFPSADISFVSDVIDGSENSPFFTGSWMPSAGHSFSFGGIQFAGACMFGGPADFDKCSSASGSTLSFTSVSGKLVDSDFSKSASVTFGAGCSMRSSNTKLGSGLSISGTNSSPCVLVSESDDVIAPSVGAHGELRLFSGRLVSKTIGGFAAGVAANGKLVVRGVVDAVDPNGDPARINLANGSFKDIAGLAYDKDNSSDLSTDVTVPVSMKIEGLTPSEKNTNELYVDTAVGNNTSGNGTKNTPYKTVAVAIANAQYPCYIEIAARSALVTEAVSIPAIASNLQFGAGNKNTRSGQLSLSGQWSVAYAASGTPRHTYRGFTWNTGATNPWSVTNGVATPSLELQDCSFVGTFTGDLAPQPTNFTGNLTVRNVDQSSAPLASLRIYAGATYNFHSQTSIIACSFAFGTGAGATVNIHASCSPAAAALPITFTGTLNSYNAAPATVAGVIQRQVDLTAMLASTNTTTYPNGFYLVSGFAPSQNTALRGAVIGHLVVGGVAFNWLERQAAYAPASVVDGTGVSWTEYPNSTYLPSNLTITALLATAPTVATAAGYYIQTSGAVSGYALNDIIYVNNNGGVSLACTYANAPSSVTVGVGSSSTLAKVSGAWGFPLSPLYLSEACFIGTTNFLGGFIEQPLPFNTRFPDNSTDNAHLWFNTSANTWTPQVAGTYVIQVMYDVFRGGGSETSISIRKNNAYIASTSTIGGVVLSVTKTLRMTTSDYIDVVTSGGAPSSRGVGLGNACFTAYRIGD